MLWPMPAISSPLRSGELSAISLIKSQFFLCEIEDFFKLKNPNRAFGSTVESKKGWRSLSLPLRFFLQYYTVILQRFKIVHKLRRGILRQLHFDIFRLQYFSAFYMLTVYPGFFLFIKIQKTLLYKVVLRKVMIDGCKKYP